MFEAAGFFLGLAVVAGLGALMGAARRLWLACLIWTTATVVCSLATVACLQTGRLAECEAQHGHRQ